jgi:hypothetical protein
MRYRPISGAALRTIRSDIKHLSWPDPRQPDKDKQTNRKQILWSPSRIEISGGLSIGRPVDDLVYARHGRELMG